MTLVLRVAFVAVLAACMLSSAKAFWPFDTAAVVTEPTTDGAMTTQGISSPCNRCPTFGLPGPRGLPGPGAVIAFSSGIIVPTTLGVPLSFVSAFGSSSIPTSLPLTAFQLNAFAFSAPRAGTLSGLDVTITAAFNTSLAPLTANVTIVVALLEATAGSDSFSPTGLAVSFFIPAGTTSATVFNAQDLTHTFPVLAGEQFVLQTTITNTALTNLVLLTLSESAGVVYA